MEIDVEAVAAVAVGFETSETELAAVADKVRAVMFGAVGVGRNYADVGARIAVGLDGVESAVRRWGEASKDNAVRLRGGIAGYSAVDGDAASSAASSNPRGIGER